MSHKRLSDYEQLSKDALLEIVKSTAGDSENKSLEVVASRIIDIPEFSSSIHMRDEETADDYMKKWTNKFLNGYLNRPSRRTSNPIGTQHDPILDEIISARIHHTNEDLEAIKYGHRLSMSAENIAGSLLEEYISISLLPLGWHCCWGDTMRSIDFCNVDGQLLQIKNSDNSENSSSKTVRNNTEIIHWFRRFSKNGETNWRALNELVKIENEDDKLSEEFFKEFVRNTIAINPGALFLEDNSPFYGIEEENKDN